MPPSPALYERHTGIPATAAEQQSERRIAGGATAPPALPTIDTKRFTGAGYRPFGGGLGRGIAVRARERQAGWSLIDAMVAGALLMGFVVVASTGWSHVQNGMFMEKIHLAAINRINGEMSRLASIYQNPDDMGVSGTNFCYYGLDEDVSTLTANNSCVIAKTASSGYSSVPSVDSEKTFIHQYDIRAIYKSDSSVNNPTYVQSVPSNGDCDSINLSNKGFCWPISYYSEFIPDDGHNISPAVIAEVLDKVLSVADGTKTFNWVWLDPGNDIAARLSWIIYKVENSTTCLLDSGLTSGACKRLIVFLDYPYRANIKRNRNTINVPTFANDPALGPIRTITLQTIVGYRSNK